MVGILSIIQATGSLDQCHCDMSSDMTSHPQADTWKEKCRNARKRPKILLLKFEVCHYKDKEDTLFV